MNKSKGKKAGKICENILFVIGILGIVILYWYDRSITLDPNNNKIGGRNMVGRAVNRLAGRLTAVALTAAMAVSMLAGCAAGGKNTETAAKKEYKAFRYGADECEK